jgi:hypothetical protein
MLRTQVFRAIKQNTSSEILISRGSSSSAPKLLM